MPRRGALVHIEIDDGCLTGPAQKNEAAPRGSGLVVLEWVLGVTAR